VPSPKADDYAKTQLVLKRFGISDRTNTPEFLRDLQNTASVLQIQHLLKFFDTENVFNRFAKIQNDKISMYKDFGFQKVLDFSFQLNPGDQDYRNDKPLQGLRVALDPGHMGGQYWDKATGKYVTDGRGNYLSEGVLNLQVALLLKEQLRKLGAIVLVTHENLGPVSKLDHRNFDITPYAKNELRDSVLSSWFLKLLNAHSREEDLGLAFENSPERKKLYSDRRRSEYFIKRADLFERTRLIDDFKADVSLIIHFDTSDPASNPNGLNPRSPNATKIFVVGGYDSSELASSAQKKYFARHLLDYKSWRQSLNLSRSLVKSMTQELGTKAQVLSRPSVMVEPGIIARNLIVPRISKTPAMAYIECLYYNRPQEFVALSQKHHVMKIDGKDYYYSDRLKQVSDSILAGLLDYVRN
jgi:N-acetylmuramoyl-L-alanine amidase